MTSSRLFRDAWKYGVNFLRSEACILLLILLLALFLRIYRLEQVPAGLYYDEISAVYVPYLYQMGLVDVSIRSTIACVLSGTFFTYAIFGPSILFTRLPEVLLGTLLVFVTYSLATEMFSKRVGLISALLMALSPWALHFSRFQAFCSAYVLYITVAILFLYKGINSSNGRRQFILYCFGSLLLSLSANIHASSRVLVPLFIVGFLIAYLRIKPLKIVPFLPEGIVCTAIFLLAYSPVFLDYLTHDPISSRTLAYSTYSHSQNIFDLSRMVLERVYTHLSPGFLVFTSPAAHDLPFQETISKTGLLRLSPTIFGELNYYGVLVYPGILLLAYKAVKKRSKEHAVLLWWIVCYLIVSGVAYYGSPNAARNIVGLPALIITIALLMNFLVEVTLQEKNIGRFAISVLAGFLICIIAIPAGLFLHEYYVTYADESAKVFDYGYREVANYLSANGLWERDIYIHGGWDRDQTLSFYSPEQPPSSKIVNIYNVRKLDPKDSWSISETDLINPFKHGAIEYETRINEGYGGATSSQIRLIRDKLNTLRLTIYAEDSTYEPNGYLLKQTVNGELYFEQRSIGEIVERRRWYAVRLVVNSTAISFYFDGKLITTWQRRADDTYIALKLVGVSASVSFKYLTTQDNKAHSLFNNFSNWKMISEKSEIKRDIDGDITLTLFPISVNALLVTHHQEDAATLSDYGIPCKLLKNIYYPDGTLAFSIFELISDG